MDDSVDVSESTGMVGAEVKIEDRDKARGKVVGRGEGMVRIEGTVRTVVEGMVEVKGEVVFSIVPLQSTARNLN